MIIKSIRYTNFVCLIIIIIFIVFNLIYLQIHKFNVHKSKWIILSLWNKSLLTSGNLLRIFHLTPSGWWQWKSNSFVFICIRILMHIAVYPDCEYVTMQFRCDKTRLVYYTIRYLLVHYWWLSFALALN